METVRTLDRIGDEIITLTRGLQDLAASTVEAASKTVEGFVPKLPWPETLTPPAAREVAASLLRVQEELVKSQKEFVLRILGALEPVVRPIRAPKSAKAR